MFKTRLVTLTGESLEKVMTKKKFLVVTFVFGCDGCMMQHYSLLSCSFYTLTANDKKEERAAR